MTIRIAFPLLLAASACWVPVEKGRQMDDRIQRLEAESAATTRQLEEQRNLIRDRIARVDQKIAEVQKKLDELNTTAHRSGADVVANQDRLQETLTRMQGQLEEEQHRLLQMDQRAGQFQSDTEARFAALKGAGALEDYEGRKRAEALKRPADKAEFFALAQQQEQAGERAVARQLYDEYVKRWPTDPRRPTPGSVSGRSRSGRSGTGRPCCPSARSPRTSRAPTRRPTPCSARGRP